MGGYGGYNGGNRGSMGGYGGYNGGYNGGYGGYGGYEGGYGGWYDEDELSDPAAKTVKHAAKPKKAAVHVAPKAKTATKAKHAPAKMTNSWENEMQRWEKEGYQGYNDPAAKKAAHVAKPKYAAPKAAPKAAAKPKAAVHHAPTKMTNSWENYEKSYEKDVPTDITIKKIQLLK